jgi:hypothetical protein
MSSTPSSSWRIDIRRVVYLILGLVVGRTPTYLLGQNLLTYLFLKLLAALAWQNQDSSQTSTSKFARTINSGFELIVDTNSLSVPLNSTLHSRDTYQCSAEAPCSNGACCGGSGYCGYGPAYCGNNCVSNCDAVAQCGQYAEVAGTICPLNTCCSQFGFCGTTSDFCESK